MHREQSQRLFGLGAVSAPDGRMRRMVAFTNGTTSTGVSRHTMLKVIMSANSIRILEGH
jgi:hypothetical protein